MSHGPTVVRLKKLMRLAADALTGRMGVAMMVLSYSACAVVMLAYVSAQVYTSSLMEDVAARQREQRTLKEEIGLEMQRWAELSSKQRIGGICREKLGMVPGDDGGPVRVTVETDGCERRATPPVASARTRPVEIEGVLGADINELTRVIQK